MILSSLYFSHQNKPAQIRFLIKLDFRLGKREKIKFN